MTKRMVLLAVFVPPDWIDRLDSLVEQGYYPSRAEAIRMAIRDLLKHHGAFKKQAWKRDVPHETSMKFVHLCATRGERREGLKVSKRRQNSAPLIHEAEEKCAFPC